MKKREISEPPTGLTITGTATLLTEAKDEGILAPLVSNGVKNFVQRLKPEAPNVSDTERPINVILGAALAIFGAHRIAKKNKTGHSKSNLLLGGVSVAAGAALIMRGVTGYCPFAKSSGSESRDSLGDTNTDEGVHVEKSVTIQRSAAYLYDFWRDFENIPLFMDHIVKVEFVDDKHSHWIAEGPAGLKVSWNAEIISDKKNELLMWESVDGSEVKSTGSVQFVEIPNHGTQVKVYMQYRPTGGNAGVKFAQLFRKDAATEIAEDLQHFKELMEAGEISTVEGQPSARA